MTGTYDTWLATLSVLTAIVAIFTALNLVQRVTVSSGITARTWLCTGAVVMGAGIWSAQFLALLAFRLPVTVVHHPPTMLFALGFTMLISFFALWLASGPRLGVPRMAVAGVCMGLGLVGMHYTGLFAMQIIPAIHYDAKMFASAVALAVAGSWLVLGLAMALRQGRSVATLLGRAGAAVLGGGAISGAHFTGMAAARFAPDSYSLGAAADQAGSGSGGLLLILAAFAALGLLALLLLTSIDHVRESGVAGQDGGQIQLGDWRKLEHRFGELHDASSASGHLVALMVVDPGEAAQPTDPASTRDEPLLQEVARRLAVLVRPGDAVARLEDGQFVLLLAKLGDAGQVARIAVRVREELGRSIQVADNTVQLTPRIGSSIYPTDGEDLDTLLRIACKRSTVEG